MRKILIILLTIILLSIRTEAQEPIYTYLPIIFSEGNKMAQQYPILAINSESGERINLLEKGSGIQLDDPYWSPNITQLKGGGTFVNPQTASGRALVHAEYDNVIETIPLRITGEQGWITIRNLRRMLNLSVNAQSYWTQIFEQDKVWLEIRADCDNHLTGYSTIYTISLPNITSPYTRPFVNPIDKSQFDTISMVIEREPFFSPLEPGEIIGPLYNLIRNPDFELWNFGVADSQPDSWNNLETVSIIGTNNRTQSDVKWGNNALEIAVTGSTAIGEAKGVTQVLDDTKDSTTYTVLAWVKNDGVSNGVGRILITYSDQLELYRDDSSHDWQLYSGTITTGSSDVVGISVEILSTGNNTLGTIYIDGLMFVEGDWTQEAADNLMGYMTTSQIVNHWDQASTALVDPGDINYVDVWNLPGDVDSLVKIEMLNNTNPAEQSNPIEQYETIRIGLRRTGDIFNFANYNDPGGINDQTASSDDRVLVTGLTSNWQEIITRILNNNISDNIGRFRVYARVYDTANSEDSTLKLRLRYWIGSSGINEVVLAEASTPIIRNWTIVDLNPDSAINFDTKFLSLSPEQLGYKLETRKTSGSDDIYFDYSILLPTDGGFIEATLNPPLTFGNAFVIDNTQKLDVFTIGKFSSGWKIAYNTNQTVTDSLASYNGSLYIGTNNSIHRFQNDSGNIIFAGGATALESYAGSLWRGGVGVFETDGVNLTGTLRINTAPAGAVVRTMIGFNGKLWAGADNANAHVYSWDGSTQTTELTTGAVNRFYSMAVYQNRLYVGASNGQVYDYNPVSDTWNFEAIAAANENVNTLEVFNGKLYAGIITNANSEIYSFDGNTWTLEYSLTATSDMYALKVLNNRLYGAQMIPTVGPGVIVSDDGENWSNLFSVADPLLTMVTMEVHDGQLYVATVDSSDNTGPVYAISSTDNIQKISEYDGGGFSAPNRTLQSDSRHRYFFSYDRENFVNNIDDKALIGIGYRPRYFSLISVDEF